MFFNKVSSFFSSLWHQQKARVRKPCPDKTFTVYCWSFRDYSREFYFRFCKHISDGLSKRSQAFKWFIFILAFEVILAFIYVEVRRFKISAGETKNIFESLRHNLTNIALYCPVCGYPFWLHIGGPPRCHWGLDWFEVFSYGVSDDLATIFDIFGLEQAFTEMSLLS